ncbi:hypothetical protein FA95DRAFT_1571824 [Auriscalpium vulgare]|uniref:Uncharacterized protein n=1 Tax=Auriscalpium vulgare TaxID=40419 RepID=A0ACB8RWV9_9AGAM|nr:hypothetical protein FA95DRAFT_1571824 [Auriscalpium vulgare]
MSAPRPSDPPNRPRRREVNPIARGRDSNNLSHAQATSTARLDERLPRGSRDTAPNFKRARIASPTRRPSYDDSDIVEVEDDDSAREGGDEGSPFISLRSRRPSGPGGSRKENERPEGGMAEMMSNLMSGEEGRRQLETLYGMLHKLLGVETRAQPQDFEGSPITSEATSRSRSAHSDSTNEVHTVHQEHIIYDISDEDSVEEYIEAEPLQSAAIPPTTGTNRPAPAPTAQGTREQTTSRTETPAETLKQERHDTTHGDSPPLVNKLPIPDKQQRVSEENGGSVPRPDGKTAESVLREDVPQPSEGDKLEEQQFSNRERGIRVRELEAARIVEDALNMKTEATAQVEEAQKKGIEMKERVERKEEEIQRRDEDAQKNIAERLAEIRRQEEEAQKRVEAMDEDIRKREKEMREKEETKENELRQKEDAKEEEMRVMEEEMRRKEEETNAELREKERAAMKKEEELRTFQKALETKDADLRKKDDEQRQDQEALDDVAADNLRMKEEVESKATKVQQRDEELNVKERSLQETREDLLALDELLHQRANDAQSRENRVKAREGAAQAREVDVRKREDDAIAKMEDAKKRLVDAEKRLKEAADREDETRKLEVEVRNRAAFVERSKAQADESNRLAKLELETQKRAVAQYRSDLDITSTQMKTTVLEAKRTKLEFELRMTRLDNESARRGEPRFADKDPMLWQQLTANGPPLPEVGSLPTPAPSPDSVRNGARSDVYSTHARSDLKSVNSTHSIYNAYDRMTPPGRPFDRTGQ